MTILLVDDDKNMTEIWSRMLREVGVDIRIADSVDSAIRQMQVLPMPDLILLDLNLPPHGPAQTLAALDVLRRFNPDLKCVVVTGMQLDSVKEIVERARVQYVMSKDAQFSQRKLLTAVQAALAGCKDTKELTALSLRLSEILSRTVA